MINVIIADAGSFLDECEKNGIEEVYEKYADTFLKYELNKDAADKNNLYIRVCAYRLLEHVYKEKYGEQIKAIVRNDFGKPKLTDDAYGFDFNISHTENTVALAYLEKGDKGQKYGSVGVDIETRKKLCKTEKLAQKYLKNVNNSIQIMPFLPFNVEFYEILLGEKNEKFLPLSTPCFDAASTDLDNDFFDRWTCLEAALKADGRGFAGFKDSTKTLEQAQIQAYRFAYKSNEYSLALALV